MTNPLSARHPLPGVTSAGDDARIVAGRRAPSPAVVSASAATGHVSLLRSMSHLTNRDLMIADWLDRHGVLTTAQITTALFGNLTTAQHRLAKLYRIGLIDRFHRPLSGGGFGPWHWVIGALGAQLTAAARNAAPPTPRQLELRHARLAASVQLAHRLGTNQFFIDLYAHTRSHPQTRLLRWWSEREATYRYSHRIYPDGHALWHQDGTTIGLFLEHDTGTESFARLTRKIDAYDQLAADGGPAYPVLFWLGDPQRERGLHILLDQRPHPAPVVVATAVRGSGHGPAGPVWWTNGADRRCTLAELPFDHGDPNSMYNPNLHDPTLDQEL
jgi:Replication-relaxation